MARIINTGTTGTIYLAVADNPLTITSTGAITATGTGADGIGGAAGTTWTVTNNGTVSSLTGNGVALSGPATVSSSGGITGKDGIVLRAGGNVFNSGSIGASGAMGTGAASGAAVWIAGGSGTVANYGTLNGQAYGVELDAGGMVTNTGAIFGGHNGVRVFGATGTVTNSGSITGAASDVISLTAGGSVSNAAGASITGQGSTGAAIYSRGAAGIVTNAGNITGIPFAIDLASGGTVTNNAGGNISSKRGVYIKGGSGVVTNAGSIAGSTAFGVKLAAGGQVSNAAGASISGPLGVVIYGAAGAITNNGTISGTTHAVTFSGGGANRLVVGSTSVVIGDVVGSTAVGSTNTLELAGGSGTLSGLSAGSGIVTENALSWSFRNFASIALDTGAAWTLSGSNTIATILNNGTLNIANVGSLTVTTAIDPASAGVFGLNNNALLDFAADVGSGVQVAFLGLTGVLELADVVNGVVRQFNGTIVGLNVGTSATIPTDAVNIQATVTNATLSGNKITVFNNATTVATLVLNAAPGAGTSVVTQADVKLGGYDIFLTNALSPTPTVTWSPTSQTGVEGSAIALSTIAATGSTVTSILVSDVPLGATLSDGTHSFTATAGSTSVDVLEWDDAALSIQPINDANFSLSVQATDVAGNVSAVIPEAVTVDPLAPTVGPGPVSGTAGQAIALNLGIAANGLAGDSNSLSSVTLGNIPIGATLSNARGDTLTVSGGSITFTAGQLAAGVLNGLAINPASAGSFALTIAATEHDAQGDLSTTITSSEALTVVGVATVTWSPSVATGVEGSAIGLGTIATSGSTLTSVLVSGVPLGATLSDGTHSFTATAGSTAVNVLGWNDAALSIKPANDTNFTLSVQATDTAGNVSAVASEAVTADPLAPTVAPGLVSGTAGQVIALNLGIALNGLAGDSNSVASVTISAIPSGATLSNTNGNTLTVSGGSITFSAAQLAAGVLNGLAINPASAGSFSLSVAATEQDAQGDPSTATTGTEALTVTGAVGSGGTISTNITGPFVLSAAFNPLTIINTGKVTSTGTGADAIDGAAGTPWTITNNGTVSSSSGNGVALAGAGTISSSGLISGKTGVSIRGGGSVSNSGSIAASGTVGGGGSVGAGVFTTGGRGTVTNNGVITGGAYGVALDAGGTVTNTSAITGGEDGVRIIGGTGTVTNSGSIFSTVDDGIGFFNGGTVSNAVGAAIGNRGTKGAGIYITGASGTVTNAGSITGVDYGLDLARGGSVTNFAGAIISSHRGVVIQGAVGFVGNSGSITGTTSLGIKLAAGGQVSNSAGGLISGFLGVAVYSAVGTVTNNGTISGTSHAVTFAGGGANRLVVGSSGVFIGDVVGSIAAGSSNTMELAGGSGAISGLTGGAGTVTENAHTWSFKNFTTVAVDAGGSWTLSGSNTIATILDNGIIDLGGSLIVSGAIDPASTGVFQLDGKSLETAAALGTNSQISFVGSSRLTIDNVALFGTNVGTGLYAGPQLKNFGADDKIDLKVFGLAGVALNYSASTGLLQVSNSSGQVASLNFQNASLGVGAFQASGDAASGIFIVHA